VWRWRRRGPDAVNTPPTIEVLVARRHADAVRGGLWELPGGKIERGESAAGAALREVREETGVELAHAEELGTVEHHDQTATREALVRLHAVIACVGSEVEAKPLGSAECRWITLAEFDDFAWPPANAALNALIRARLSQQPVVGESA
jgi:mutator protein MutT